MMQLPPFSNCSYFQMIILGNSTGEVQGGMGNIPKIMLLKIIESWISKLSYDNSGKNTVNHNDKITAKIIVVSTRAMDNKCYNLQLLC